MYSDQQGNTLTAASAESLELYTQALYAFNIYRGDPVALLDQAIQSQPDFVMAHLLKAWLYAVATEPEASLAASEMVREAAKLPMNDLESSHLACLEQLLLGKWDAAAISLDQHSAKYPHDLVALQCGHLLDFYRANNRDLRDRIARALPHWSADIPGYSILLGMYAFGLEETGQYGQAEDTGRDALVRDPLDCWAHHAVAHVMEMQGRVEDGIGWMQTRQPNWDGEDNFFRVHNWWHLALYHLDLGQTDKVLELYDGPIRSERSQVALDMVDASALLWRLAADGEEVGDRWHELADSWQAHADGQLYPFNDWHAVMAWLGAGRDDAVEQLACQMQECRQSGDIANWAQQTGLPLIRGFQAFWHGNYQEAADLLYPARYIVNRFGGSHAQRDIIDWTLAQALVRAGQHNMAEALACERLALKPGSQHNRLLLNQALQ